MIDSNPETRLIVEPSPYGLFVVVTMERIRDGRQVVTTMTRAPKSGDPVISKLKRSLTHD